MVQVKYFSVLFLLLGVKVNSQIDSEESSEEETSESKKIYIKYKGKIPSKTPMNDFHCDLHLMPQQEEMMYSSFSDEYSEGEIGVRKREISFDLFKWPKNKEGFVIVPYHVSRKSLYTSDQVRLIRTSMDHIEGETCIRFKPRTFETDFVHIHSGKFCKSNLGRTGGAQELSLNNERCFHQGIIVHELLHALGFIHTQSRPDRDNHVDIIYKNIDPRFYREFEKVNPAKFNYYGTGYDYYSVMHYSSLAFSKNGGKTIIPKDKSFTDIIGQRGGLSTGDSTRINNKYKCGRKAGRFLSNHESSLIIQKPPISDSGFYPILRPQSKLAGLKLSSFDEPHDLYSLHQRFVDY